MANPRVLRAIHHRHKWLGVRMITYPIWSPQNLLKDDFIQEVEKELQRHEKRKSKNFFPMCK